MVEKRVRGFSNHRRIQILLMLSDGSEMDVTHIAGACGIQMQTAAEHVRRLEAAGLLRKRKQKRSVVSSISPFGQQVLAFLETIA